MRLRLGDSLLNSPDAYPCTHAVPRGELTKLSPAPTYSDFFYSAQDGLRLHARIYGADNDALAAVCLPGLTRNARDFHQLALYLAREARKPRKVIVFEYRGRGESAYDPDWKKYDPLVETGDVLAGLTALGIEHAGFIGTSRGGLIIMIVSAMRPAVLKAAVLNDVGPVIEGAGLAAIRAYLERAPKPKNIDEAVAIAKAVHGPAFPALGDADWRRMAGSIYREEDGRLMPDFDPKLLNTVTSVDFSQPLPVLWPQFMGMAGVPLMAIRGANSKLLSAETLAEMGRRHPRAETITVDGQGHAPLLETGELPKRIADFLERAG